MEVPVDARYVYFAMTLAVFSIIVAVVYSILFISKKIGMWGLFSKAGEKEWKAIVPIYNQVTLLKICKLKTWYIVFYLDFIIPIVGYFGGRDVRWVTIIMLIGFVIYRFMISIRLGQAYKKGDVFSFFMAFFPSILFPVLGWSKEQKYEAVNVTKIKK